MTTRALLLFTNCFPFGSGEEFLENEIKEASLHFDTIVIVPERFDGVCREIPPNAKVAALGSREHSKFCGFVEFSWLLFREIYIQKLRYFLLRIKSCRVHFEYYRQQRAKVDAIRRLVEELREIYSSVVIYDFWFTNNALAIALSKVVSGQVKYIACAHNFDLYDFRWGCPIPFRGLCFEVVDKVFPDSAFGVEYLKSVVPERFHSKIELSYMGTPDYGMAQIPDGPDITVLSTSSCVAHKRVDLIVESLSNVEGHRVKWVHFGDGELLEYIKKKAEAMLAPGSFIFMGWVKYADLIEFYKQHKVDVFLHLSVAEGLPVSLMIAASFGVPIVAIDSMGVKELVLPSCGVVLPSNATTKDIADAIERTLERGSRSTDYRRLVRDSCLRKFGLFNYADFYGAKINSL